MSELNIYMCAAGLLLAFILVSMLVIFLISLLCLLIFDYFRVHKIDQVTNHVHLQPHTTILEYYLQCNFGHLNDLIPLKLQQLLIEYESEGHEIFFFGDYVKWLDCLNGIEPPIYMIDTYYCYNFDLHCSWLPVTMVHNFGHSIMSMPFVNKITLFRKNNGDFIFIPIYNVSAIPIPLPLAQVDCEEVARVEDILRKKIIVSVIQPCSLEKLCILILM